MKDKITLSVTGKKDLYLSMSTFALSSLRWRKYDVYSTKQRLPSSPSVNRGSMIQSATTRSGLMATLSSDRNRHGGGVLVYVKDGLAFNQRPDLEVEGC